MTNPTQTSFGAAIAMTCHLASPQGLFSSLGAPAFEGNLIRLPVPALPWVY
jgi:hypothetical protein